MGRPRRDEMSSKERMDALMSGQQPDRVPFDPFARGFCARNVGYSVASFYNDPEKSFQSQVWTKEQYGYDGNPSFGYASYGAWEFGGEVKFPSSEWSQAPSITRYAVESEEDVDKLELPDVKTAGFLPLAMEFSRLQAEHGTAITLVLGSSFTIAGNMCPVEILYRWMLRKPELVHRLLRLATAHIIDTVKYWADIFGAEQVIPQIWEPLANNDIISPKQFEHFILPYLQESSASILGTGIKHIFYHICGQQNLNLPYWSQVSMGNPGICSVGSEIEIGTAIKHLGDKAIIAGNIAPHILLTGRPQQVYDLCKNAIEAGKKAPRGFMLMSGCETPPDTPPYNIYMMRKAINDSGWY